MKRSSKAEWGRRFVLEKARRGCMRGLYVRSGIKSICRVFRRDGGSVLGNGDDVDQIPTKRLRDLERYVIQETHLFHDSIANNIALVKKRATRGEITEAAKKRRSTILCYLF